MPSLVLSRYELTKRVDPVTKVSLKHIALAWAQPFVAESSHLVTALERFV